MNERVMQFRIGMFVIVAGLVLTMLIVWFGESPSLFRDHAYVTAHYAEAPGVNEGIPVRKSGIRIGEVASIRFDDRPRVKGKVASVDEAGAVVQLGAEGRGRIPAAQIVGPPPRPGDPIEVVVGESKTPEGLRLLAMPDGVLVTLSLERKYKLLAGSTPRINRSLIGDISIDMLPGDGPGLMPMADDPADAAIVEGAVAPDPAGALAAATAAFERVGGTLESIDLAAQGVARLSTKAEGLDRFLATWSDTGAKVGVLADDLEETLQASRADIRPAISNARQVAERLNATLDDSAQADARETLRHLATASARLDAILADIEPAARDLGAPASQRESPATNLGQSLKRINAIAYDVSLLSQTLRDGRGGLNGNGTLQKLLTDPSLYENVSQSSASFRIVLASARTVIENLKKFSERIANNPGELTRGALRQ